MELFEIIGGGQKDELGGQPPELALSTAPNNRANLEYLYTLIRFSTTADWVCAELLKMPNLVT